MRNALVLIFILFSFTSYSNHVEIDTLSISQKRKLTITGISAAGVYTGSMYLLYQTWYKDYSSSKFHFFNDLTEWKGMDKIGHVTTSLFIAQWLQSIQEVTGLNNRKSALRSVLVPLVFMTTIEVFDGFSTGWGFSVADIAANTIGLSVFYAQERIFNEQLFLLKYSFNSSPYARLRPNLLGKSIPEQMLKDYNGQTYWLSFPLKNMWPQKDNRIPSWLNLSAGYGVDGLIGARSNVWSSDQLSHDYSNIARSHQWYLSFDIDLKKLPIRGKAWQLFSSTVRWIKIPAPTISYNKYQGFRASPIHW